ncbi:hypothetical protein [Stutzerimonas stutzeri]|uniref:hypothetical protein n=1 Tax=Stutzerimonas stutzeri TaxID=316 RepID=UPI0032B33EC4
MNKKIILLAVIAMLTGCSVAPSRNEIASKDFGPRPTDEASQKAVVSYMYDRLIDPNSGMYKCGSPKKGGGFTCTPGSCGTRYGYILGCRVNAKNKLGGYTGWKDHYFMLYEDNGSLKAYDMEIHPNHIRVIE